MTIEQDVNALRGQMLFRSKNLGVKELDLIVGSWAVHFLKTLSYEQLLQYNQEVIRQ
jgi:succinate dehydrogenase flavin-adding protein (antitoxin of CptAB toxin-antitoxin module)